MPKKQKREREVEREMEYEEAGGDAFDDAEEAPPASSSAADAVTVTGAMVAAWRKELLRSEKAATLKKVVGAFRAAVRLGDDEDSAGSGEYVFESAHTFNALIQLCLQEMHGILRRHVAGGAAKLEAMPKTRSGVERPDGCAHWKKHQAVARSYLLHAILFLRKLSEPAMTLALLQHLQKLLPFALTFPALCPKLLKELLRAWSAGPHECTLVAFAQIRVLATELPFPFVEDALKGLYLAHARACRSVTRKSLPRIMLTASCFVDACAIDPQTTYQLAFVHIRQLAIHLRNATQKGTEEAHLKVYNWQFVNCVRLWVQVLVALCPEEPLVSGGGKGGGGKDGGGEGKEDGDGDGGGGKKKKKKGGGGKDAGREFAQLRQLVYPLVQVALGTAQLLPNIRFAALRFHCVRAVGELASKLRVLVPLAPLLTDCFSFAELAKAPSSKDTERPTDWTVLFKVSKADASKRVYQEALLSRALFLLAEHFHHLRDWTAFPEMSYTCILALRAAAKKSKIRAFQQRARALASQLEGHATWMVPKRQAKGFDPRDDACAFLSEGGDGAPGAADKAPFAKWFAQERATAEAAEAKWQELADGQEAGVQADGADADGDGDARPKKKKKKDVAAGAGWSKAAAADDDDDDEEEEEAPPPKKKKKKKGGAANGTEQRGGRAESPLLEDSSAPDQVDDLNLEDLNEYEKKVADW